MLLPCAGDPARVACALFDRVAADLVAEELGALSERRHAAMLGALRDYLEAWRSLSSTHGIARPVLFDDRPAALAAIPAPADAESLGKLQDGPVFTPAL